MKKIFTIGILSLSLLLVSAGSEGIGSAYAVPAKNALCNLRGVSLRPMPGSNSVLDIRSYVQKTSKCRIDASDISAELVFLALDGFIERNKEKFADSGIHLSFARRAKVASAKIASPDGVKRMHTRAIVALNISSNGLDHAEMLLQFDVLSEEMLMETKNGSNPKILRVFLRVNTMTMILGILEKAKEKGMGSDPFDQTLPSEETA